MTAICHPERSEGSLAENDRIGGVFSKFVILSAAKDLQCTFVQQTQLT
jgi:hypothetical protein